MSEALSTLGAVSLPLGDTFLFLGALFDLLGEEVHFSSAFNFLSELSLVAVYLFRLR